MEGLIDIARCYIEYRKTAARGTDSIAADVMRHLHARQHLGKAVVVCDVPVPMLSAARKQWLKLSRAIQKQRASTLNADKILKYTHMITHMQHMHFSAKTPAESPGSDVYFLRPHEVANMPIHCWTVYVLNAPSLQHSREMIRLLPTDALVVDYTRSHIWQQLELPRKALLEHQVEESWQRCLHFLAECRISVEAVARAELGDIEAMDDALDTLLGVSHRFLQTANDFQRSLELARPLRLGRDLRGLYDALILLAHRVQALSPGAFSQQFLEVYNEDDTFFLYDPEHDQWLTNNRNINEEYQRHLLAGRVKLAAALLHASQKRPLHEGSHRKAPPWAARASPTCHATSR